jgi:hypothetical protein
VFRLEPLQRDPGTIKLEWCHKDSDPHFDASSLSDGTLRFIALATLLHQPQKYRPSARGGTEFKRLSRDDLATCLEDDSLGELREKNEIGGRPAPE